MNPGKIPDHLNAKDRSLAKAYQKSRPGHGHKTFCHAADVNMLFAQDGNVYVCCHNQTYSIGKYPEQSISEIWNSEAVKTLRNHLSNYELEGGCKICADDFQRGAFQEIRARHFDSMPAHPDYPVMMEFLLSNVCNLECVMCSGQFSSLIRKNRENLPPLHTPYDDAFIQQLDEFIPYLKETRFSGSGEAFSIDMNYLIWKKIIQKNPDSLIMVQTNGTILTGRVKEILERGRFQIGISIDSLKKEVYESIRVNANFDKVMDNLIYFRDYCRRKNTRFSLSMCGMRQNWEEIPDFIRFCNQHGATATIHKVWHPMHSAIYNLPKNDLLKIYQFYKAQKLPANTKTDRINKNHFNYFTSIIKEWYENAYEEVEISTEEVSLNFIETEEYIHLTQNLIEHIKKNHSGDQNVEEEIKKSTHNLNLFFNLLTEQEREKAISMGSGEYIGRFSDALLYMSPQALTDQLRELLQKDKIL
ncbi:MAG TPA: radical SAM protein [Chitinophagales bacterium]|nr:radical SAM protein [Chitinophagales bacterium]